MNCWKLITSFVAVFAFGVGANTTWAQHHEGGQKHDEKDKKPTVPTCPVMGGPIDFSVKVATRGGLVYFCCEGCIKKYQAKPEKYAKKLAEQRKAVAALPKVQVTCPVSGKAVDEKVSIKHEGRKVYFCCKDCVSRFKTNPAKYKTRLANSYTYQTKCPVMGEDINPEAYVTLANGQKVFFCCAGCDKKFLEDPAKYAARLEAQGTKVDPAKIKADKKGRHDKHDDHDSHDHGGGDH